MLDSKRQSMRLDAGQGGAAQISVRSGHTADRALPLHWNEMILLQSLIAIFCCLAKAAKFMQNSREIRKFSFKIANFTLSFSIFC